MFDLAYFGGKRKKLFCQDPTRALGKKYYFHKNNPTQPKHGQNFLIYSQQNPVHSPHWAFEEINHPLHIDSIL